ncbi:MAG TPA: SprT family zinc-dependent metalloprotease [Stellaceae bacterium]|nr:SprT family zinc-dependent metalloprotease [Stellaceae bacterium]
MPRQLRLGDVEVDVVLKDIKNIHLSVHPPTGRVSISAPSRMSLDAIRLFAISKLGWIKQQQKKFRQQERETPREYLDRESHYVWGRRYLLTVIESEEAPSVELKHSRMILRVRPGTGDDRKQAIVEAWYREQLRQAVPPLIAKWEPAMGVKVERVFVQKMKTRWGSCNPSSKSIRLNTDLAKKPLECLEYIIVHEMAHLLVRHHNDEFSTLLNNFLPNWKLARQVLNSAPLAHIDWRI